MALIKTSGIVLRTTKYGETSLIVTLLTRDFGKVSAIANGVRTKKSRLLAGLQLFAYSEIVMYKAKQKNGLYHLDEMNVLESFSGVRGALDKMAYATYFAEVANGALSEDSPDDEVLSLVLNTLYMVDRGLSDYEKIKTVFEWRLSAVLGYAPSVKICSGCQSKDVFGLALYDGTVFCEACAKDKQGSVARLSEGMCRIIEYITLAEGKKIFSFDANENTIKYLSQVSEAYISAQLDREFKTLDYLKKVRALG
ncbi:MAG: DNA repair protein RecO [Clostridia bacterium]|nr:DNA repair protein RecO [Clostridia bacterium]